MLSEVFSNADISHAVARHHQLAAKRNPRYRLSGAGTSDPLDFTNVVKHFGVNRCVEPT